MYTVLVIDDSISMRKVIKDMINKVPVYFLRYEDLVLDPMTTLS